MASTSGRIQSGSANFSYFYFQWQLAGQDINGDFSIINWQWGLNTSNGAFWSTNAVKSVSGFIDGGLAFGANTWSNISGNGDHQLLSGSWQLNHDGNGNKSFGMSSTGFLFGEGNFSNSGSWDLPSIPRNATITSVSGNINDESNPTITFSNPAGHSVNAWLELGDLTGATQYSVRTGYSSGADFGLTTGERNAIRSAMANTGSTRLRYVIQDQSTGNYSLQDYSITIVNANPIFNTIGYHDSNSTTATITGNNQFIVQNASIINVDISSGNKAMPQKSATMVSYTANINAVPTNFAYSGSTIDQSLGTVNASTNQVLSVTAVDSRGYTTTVQVPITMLPYVAPTINVNATREDGFGADTTIALSGTYSPLTVSGTDKNSVDISTGVQYKVWAVGDSEPGSYTNVTSSSTGGNTTVSPSPIETLDQSTSFNLKVSITDAVSSTVVLSVVGIGKAAFRIGMDGFIYNENKRIFAGDDLYPIGTLLQTVVNTNPQTYLGNTWTATTVPSVLFLGETVYGWKRTV